MAEESAATPAPAAPAGGSTGLTTTNNGVSKYPMITTAAEQYPIIANGEEAVEIFKENLAGQAISSFDLTIVKVPSGGITSWEVPTVNGAQSMKTIEGIVVGISRRRALWLDPNPSSNPPDCSSADMETGVPNAQSQTPGPGGECAKCPMAQFGTAKGPDGKPRKGQACRENKMLAILVPGEIMPWVIKCPPSSLKDMLQFQTRLPVRFSGAVCRFSLAADKSDDGIKYSKIVPEFVAALPPEQAKVVLNYARVIGGQIEKAADRASSSADIGEAT